MKWCCKIILKQSLFDNKDNCTLFFKIPSKLAFNRQKCGTNTVLGWEESTQRCTFVLTELNENWILYKKRFRGGNSWNHFVALFKN